MSNQLVGSPCEAEHVQSLQCLDKNGYDKSKCGDFFDRYNACMKAAVRLV